MALGRRQICIRPPASSRWRPPETEMGERRRRSAPFAAREGKKGGRRLLLEGPLPGHLLGHHLARHTESVGRPTRCTEGRSEVAACKWTKLGRGEGNWAESGLEVRQQSGQKAAQEAQRRVHRHRQRHRHGGASRASTRPHITSI